MVRQASSAKKINTSDKSNRTASDTSLEFLTAKISGIPLLTRQEEAQLARKWISAEIIKAAAEKRLKKSGS